MFKSRKNKILAIGILFCFLLVAVYKVYAYYNDVTSFGFTQERKRYTNDMSGIITSHVDGNNVMGWTASMGPSYSQPLILSGSIFGRKNPVVVTVMNNELYAYESISPYSMQLYDPTTLKPQVVTNTNKIWGPIYLFGDGSGSWGRPYTTDASHPTYWTSADGSQKWFVTGTRDGQIFVNEITHGWLRYRIDTSPWGGTDVTSAPLVMRWNGYNIVVAGDGNGSDIVIAYFSDTYDNAKGEFTKHGVFGVHVVNGGRISSSAAPIYDRNGNALGFVIGVDGYYSNYLGEWIGVVKAFKFDGLFNVTSNGLEIKVDSQGYVQDWWWKGIASGGIPASFSVDGDCLYFSNVNGGLYALNKYDGSAIWANYTYLDAGGTFINHSPAVDDKYVYFPLKYSNVTNGEGCVAVLDKSTGAIVASIPIKGNVLTAVSVTSDKLYVGTSLGYLAVIDKGTWTVTYYPLGAPVTGEISIAHGLVAMTDFGGVYTLYLAKHPVDLSVTNIDPGTSAVESGKQYTGHVTFAAKAAPGTTVPANIKIYDVDNPNNVKIAGSSRLSFNVGSSGYAQQTVYFNYTGDNHEMHIEAEISVGIPPNPDEYLDYWDIYPGNNSAVVAVKYLPAQKYVVGDVVHATVTITKTPTYIYTKWHVNKDNVPAHMDITISWQNVRIGRLINVNGQVQEEITPATVTNVVAFHDIHRYTKIIPDDFNWQTIYPNPSYTQLDLKNNRATFRFEYPKAGRTDSTIYFKLYLNGTDQYFCVYAKIPVNGYGVSFYQDSTKTDPGFDKSVKDTETISF